jgi:hypothetical protein
MGTVQHLQQLLAGRFALWHQMLNQALMEGQLKHEMIRVDATKTLTVISKQDTLASAVINISKGLGPHVHPKSRLNFLFFFFFHRKTLQHA